VHRRLWPILAVLVLLGLAAALWLRKPVISNQESVIRGVSSDHWSLITGH